MQSSPGGLSGLLRWLFSRRARANWLRPPGAVPEPDFLVACIKCGRCALVCPYRSIRLGGVGDGLQLGTPYIEPRRVPCYLCMKCPPVCPSGALNAAVEQFSVRMGVATLDRQTCYAWNGIVCRACFQSCPVFDRAITLKDGAFPLVHDDACVGCGICENVCPTVEPAIVVRRQRV